MKRRRKRKEKKKGEPHGVRGKPVEILPSFFFFFFLKNWNSLSILKRSQERGSEEKGKKGYLLV